VRAQMNSRHGIIKSFDIEIESTETNHDRNGYLSLSSEPELVFWAIKDEQILLCVGNVCLMQEEDGRRCD